MSTWTYIYGNVKLDRYVFEEKLNKDGTYKIANENYQYKYSVGHYLTLPYPEEQFKVGNPSAVVRTYYDEKKNKKNCQPKLSHRLFITSYPIIRREVEKYIKDIPSGEENVLTHNVFSTGDYNSSTSEVESPQIEKLFNEYLLTHNNLWEGATIKDINHYEPHEVGWVEYNEQSILTISSPIRGHEMLEIYNEFMKFMQNLVADGITFDLGIIQLNQDGRYGKITLEFINNEITAHIEPYGEEAYDEYWEVFFTTYKNKPTKTILKMVDELVDENWLEAKE